ncbi:fumarylacetoacetate hydrolase family protein [Virgibacillus sp. C22-A2]|uniref:Fumarylacetoacetate hydrolase family protein n=1 Tax=Virgibacillus tibetensis TaxID=3042313 RepID=A0ABU6KJS9_9BACI|nr:fumarylacetoacetate hydrolase family protein [Virgibacillus sp. C22-A2]
MKLVSYRVVEKTEELRIGYLYDESVIDLHDAYKKMLIFKQEMVMAEAVERSLLPADPGLFFSMGQEAIDRAKEAYQYIIENGIDEVSHNKADVTISTPVPDPSKIICVGKNYADHVTEMGGGDLPTHPVLFAKFNNALIGPEDAIVKSPHTNMLDYEVELAVVIGKEASQVTKDEALDYIAGYTIGNDTTARDLQKRTPQWLQGKTLDRSTPIGPWVVTADEIADPSNLSIRSFVNGEERQSSNTSHLIFTIPFLIEFISNLITLKPGDIILTGTPDGVGFAMDPPQFLKSGDVVTLEIEGIGQMSNKVINLPFSK